MSYWARPTGTAAPASHVEAELHDVAVADDVVLALGADLADVTSSGPRTGSDSSSHWIVSARMKPRWKSVWITPAASGAVEPARKVQARILLPGGEIRAQTEHVVRRCQERRHGTVAETECLEHFLTVLLAITAASASSCTDSGTTSAPASSSRTGAAIAASSPI